METLCGILAFVGALALISLFFGACMKIEGYFRTLNAWRSVTDKGAEQWGNVIESNNKMVSHWINNLEHRMNELDKRVLANESAYTKKK